MGLLVMLSTLTLSLTGCGGGGGAASGPVFSNGVFVDSPVEGLDYQAVSKSGFTGSGGGFTYGQGELITFSIGNVPLGQAMGKDILTPIDLVPGAVDESDSTVTNMCRLLQTLDQDGDPQNGILITPQIRAEVDGRSIDFNLNINQFENDPAVMNLLDTLNATNLFTANTPRQLTSVAAARNHLRATLNTPDMDGDGYTEGQGDCNDHDSAIRPDAVDICGDGIDQDCSGGDSICDPVDPDADGDGYTVGRGDCNDDDPTIYPGAVDICGDGIDQDCSGGDPICGPIDPDADGDGYTEGQGDCNDDDATIHPDAIDICGDGIDQDCSGGDPICGPIDPDADGDGYTEGQGDCNDENAAIHPGAIDICGDGVDQDCSGGDLPCNPGNSAYETQLLELINAHRTANARAPISFDALLNSLAADHSAYMDANNSLNHDGFYDRAASSGFSYCVENVGWNYPTPEAMFQGWRNSSGHNQNMLNTYIDYAGISQVGPYVTFFACGN